MPIGTVVCFCRASFIRESPLTPPGPHGNRRTRADRTENDVRRKAHALRAAAAGNEIPARSKHAQAAAREVQGKSHATRPASAARLAQRTDELVFVHLAAPRHVQRLRPLVQLAL